MVNELTADQVRLRCDPALFHCNSTKELEPIGSIIGQKRALNALTFGHNILKPGFNIYASGQAGTGRPTAIKSFAKFSKFILPTSGAVPISKFQSPGGHVMGFPNLSAQDSSAFLLDAFSIVN